uniref:Uncharacterized protein n=1 Tax=Arundo donax TaxID=35708 RepID=A0A0A9GZK4_ARUDO
MSDCLAYIMSNAHCASTESGHDGTMWRTRECAVGAVVRQVVGFLLAGVRLPVLTPKKSPSLCSLAWEAAAPALWLCALWCRFSCYDTCAGPG